LISDRKQYQRETIALLKSFSEYHLLHILSLPDRRITRAVFQFSQGISSVHINDREWAKTTPVDTTFPSK